MLYFCDINNKKMSFQTFVTQRLAAITAMMNAIATNAKKIDELPVQSDLNPASKLHVSRDGVSESLEVEKIIDAVNSGFFDTLLYVGAITLEGNVVTVAAGARWKIGNINYANTAAIAITVPFCAIGLTRTDILVATTSNDIILIRGQETASISIRPSTPAHTVLVTEMRVTERTVGTPSDPVLGGPFVRKSEKYFADVNAPGQNSVRLYGESSYFMISDFYAPFGNVEYLIDYMTSTYVGKSYVFYNNQATNLTIVHNPSGTVANRKYFIFPSNQSFILKPGEQVEFVEHQDGNLYYLGFVIQDVDATQSGIVNNNLLQELGGVDKMINGIRIGRGNGNSTTNLALGASALNSAQISGQYNGQFNPALGSRVLTNLTTGFYNVGVGHNALASNNGHENTAIGADAMSSNTTGFQNAGLGLWALYRNTTGYWNVGIGAGALAYNVMGNRNVAIGSNALINSNDNIAIGCNNLNHLTTGSGNVAIGSSAGAISGIITGDNNLTIAPNNGAATGITVGSGNVAIGKVTGLAANAENTVTIANGVGDIRFSVNTAGLATLPSATNALIAGDTTGKAAVTKEYIETNIKPYKIYISLLTQIGKNAPVAIVLENTLGGTVVWSRNTHGNYTGTLIGALTLNKTVGSVQSNNSNRPLSFSANHSANSFEISTNGADDILVNATIEVRVYN